ncbi:MAG: hypothetical protein PHS54_01400 [Clostridia bacterium]|nr:hypothetical protein [Clostridia bacterium]
MRKRKIMIYAGMWVIKLLPTDVKDLDLEEHDEVDIEDLIILNKKKEKGKVIEFNIIEKEVDKKDGITKR